MLLIIQFFISISRRLILDDNSVKYDRRREEMVKRQIEARGVTDPQVLAAMGKVPRHLFVSEALRDQAYGDFPLPIGEQQTISQPYIVAEMTGSPAQQR